MDDARLLLVAAALFAPWAAHALWCRWSTWWHEPSRRARRRHNAELRRQAWERWWNR